MKNVDYLIIGAGITGLSLAYHLNGQDYEVYESEKSAGGMCRTENFCGFYFDYGEHFMRADEPYVRELICNLLGQNLESQPINAAIYLGGQVTNYPFQTNLFGLRPDIIKSCLVGYVNAWCSQQKKPRSVPNNFEEWIYSSFGEGIAKYFMIPYNEKIWTIHPRDMTVDWFFNDSVVPRGNLEAVIEGALERREQKQNMRWYPLKGGINSLSEAFLKHVKNVSFNKKAIDVDPANKKVTFSDGEIVQYKILLSTIPLPQLISLIADAPSVIKKAASSLKYNSVFIVNLGIEREKISPYHWMYFPESSFIFARCYFLTNFSPFMAPKNCSSVSAMITYSEHKPLDKVKIVEKVTENLIQANIIKPNDKILANSVTDVKYGFNIFTHDRRQNVELIKKYLVGNYTYSIGRYGNWEYSGIEHSILNSRELVHSLVKDKK
ncbi:MAG: FAD-dependent oxidoreductase [Candidatus Bathyarchaeia archaeon]|jgi:UDP-galactopyranose mutase